MHELKALFGLALKVYYEYDGFLIKFK